MPMLAEAWAAGYEDCFDFYARGNTPPRTRNPYGPEDRHVEYRPEHDIGTTYNVQGK